MLHRNDVDILEPAPHPTHSTWQEAGSRESLFPVAHGCEMAPTSLPSSGLLDKIGESLGLRRVTVEVVTSGGLDQSDSGVECRKCLLVVQQHFEHSVAIFLNLVRCERWHLGTTDRIRSEEHTSELQSLRHLVCRLLLEKK